MGAITQLFVDLARVALGLTPFSWLAWAYVSVLLLIVGPVLVQVAPKVVDPPARMLATQPMRVVGWMALAPLALIGIVVLTFITILLPLLFPIVAVAMAFVGYFAFARLLGEQLGRRLGMDSVPPWLAALLGIVLFRLVRALPLIGAAAHSLISWIGFAAAACMAVDSAWRWHKRRMPDAEQFRGELLVEWYPDGDPADGKPSTGTGRPVLDNVRGEEDRQPRNNPEP